MGQIKIKITKVGKKQKLAITGCTEELPLAADAKMRAVALLQDALRALGGPLLDDGVADQPAGGTGEGPHVGQGWTMSVGGKPFSISHPNDDLFSPKGLKVGDTV